MVDQVNLMIGNILAERGEVFLPEIGSLVVERKPAEKIARNTLKPPFRQVVFTKKEQGKRLATFITEAAKCDVAAADEIYLRWLTQVYQAEGVMEIAGVGKLQNGLFRTDEQFLARLNPQGTAPVKLKRHASADWVIWCGVGAILCGLGFGGYYLTTNRDQFFPKTEVVQNVAVEKPVEVQQPAEQPLVPKSDSTAAAVISPADSLLEQDAAQVVESQTPAQVVAIPAAAAGSIEAPAERVSKRNYVVLGVFGSKSNAERTITTALANHPDWKIGIYKWGRNLLVSAFESDDKDLCQEFQRVHQKEYTEMWVYTAR